MKSYYQSYEQFILTAEDKHVIRIAAEINIYSWHDEALINKLWQHIIKLLFRKHLVRVINKNYDCSVKEILSEPTRRNPHTKVSSSLHLSPAIGGNKTLSTQLYSARLTQQEERKYSKDMQGYLACGFIASAGSITKRASLYSIFISSQH